MVLQSYNILETEQEPEFEELTREAKEVFGVPIAVVSIVDMGRQWFKSVQGLDAEETPRDGAFCAHVVQRRAKDGILEVKDATKDFRFEDNPLVVGGPKIRYYAGAPLRSPEGKILGSFCIIDMVPNPKGLSSREKQRLVSFAEMAVYNMITRGYDHGQRRGRELRTRQFIYTLKNLMSLSSLPLTYFSLIELHPMDNSITYVVH